MTATTHDNLSSNLSFPRPCCPSNISPSTPWWVLRCCAHLLLFFNFAAHRYLLAYLFIFGTGYLLAYVLLLFLSFKCIPRLMIRWISMGRSGKTTCIGYISPPISNIVINMPLFSINIYLSKLQSSSKSIIMSCFIFCSVVFSYLGLLV